MKVFIYGDNTPGSGGWCYRETLLDMGLEVRHWGESEGLEKYRRSLAHRLVRKLMGRLPESDRVRHVAQVKAAVAAQRPALVLVLKGLHLAAEDVFEFRSLGAWVCNINHDDFFSQNRSNWSRVQRSAIPAYNYIFTTREVNVQEVRPLNANVEFFPFAYYPKIHRIVDVPTVERSRWNADVVFVGTHASHRVQLLERLVETVPCSYAVHGGCWSRLPAHSPVRPWVKDGDVFFDDYAKALGGAKIALGFLRKENRDDHTQRTFEIPACGGVFLGERTSRHASYYREGTEAEFFDANQADELCNKVRALLADAEHRESIRRAGSAALSRQRHTYRDRLERLLDIFLVAQKC